MRALEGAVGQGAEVNLYLVQDRQDGRCHAAELRVAGKLVNTCYAATTAEALEALEAYVGRLAVVLCKKNQEEPLALDTRALQIEVEGVVDADKDIRCRYVWVKYGIEGARHELRMPYGDARELCRLLKGLRLPCGRCGRGDNCTPTTCYEPVEEVR